MTRSKFALRATVAALVAAGMLFPAPPAVSPSKAGMDPERLARIPVRMKAFVDKGTIAGAVTLVARHGSVASLEAVGWQDLEARKPMRTDCMFEIASMTKPITALGIMILMEEGKLALSDPVEKHLPEFRGMWVTDSQESDRVMKLKRPSRPITIRDVLTHTSGLYGDNGHPPVLRELGIWLGKTLAEVVAIGSQQPLLFEPGTKWSYSSIGTATLGRIIEVAGDQPFEKFMESRMFQPLGMKDTHFFPPAEKVGRIATTYVMEDGTLKPIGPDRLAGEKWRARKGVRNPVPEGGLYSTASDLAAVYQMMLNGGVYEGKRMLSRPTVDLMTSVQTGDLSVQPGMAWGLHWSVVRDPRGAVGVPLASVGTFSHGGAYGTFGWVDPAKDLVGVFLVQRPAANDERNAFLALAVSAIAD